ncbi:DUF47 domain-containing protein [Anaerotardibacter muris]|uniref:DUF47 domain-containing protein n=1 Tax=Anaerotardibacter muris TaxID=2941505 RepID=UPI00203EE680|nr:DUF47 family protein [Anaerotardibacter muris]
MARKSGKFNYFDAFAEQAELAVKESQLLMSVIESFKCAEDLQECLPEAHQIENDADEVHHRIHDALLPDFVPPLDREDITALASALDEVVDQIEELIRSFYMYDVRFMHSDAIEFARILHNCCVALAGAVKEFPRARKSETFRAGVLEVNDREEEADRLYLEAMRRLFTEDSEHFMRVMVWSSIFDLFEDCIDQCETIADQMTAIVLKNG